jgi:NAD(P)-dependent dehydrogenase (short-subunit alcohol dehydrogenase family)
VIVHYHRALAEAEAVVAEIEALGRRSVALQADVTDRDDVTRLAEQASVFLGEPGLGVLFNNAGIYPEGSIETLAVEEWERVIALNLHGPFLVTRAVLPLLRRGAPSRIINIGSVTSYLGVPGMLHYATSKAAIAGFTRCLARELAEAGVNVNCLVPSMVATETALTDYPGVEEWAISQQAIKRYQQPEDLIGALVFLASPASDFMTGQTLVVDGGRVLL